MVVAENNSKKFIDRIQFLGVIGPFILLLTLFATLIKGSTYSWYLYLVTLVGLPFCWKLRWKGLSLTCAFLILSYLFLYSFFPFFDALWQFGASLSLMLGLYTTFIGFEEIKLMMHSLQLESQSRLENLIELDKKFNQSKIDWQTKQIHVLNDVTEYKKNLTSYKQDLVIYEKKCSVIKDELLKEQKLKNQFLNELEEKVRNNSQLKHDLLQYKSSQKSLQAQLDASKNHRERELLQELELVKDKLAKTILDVEEYKRNIESIEKNEIELNADANYREKLFQETQNLLREKIVDVQNLNKILSSKDAEFKAQKKESTRLLMLIQDNEKSLKSFENQILEKEQELCHSNKQVQELTHHLTSSQRLVEHKDIALKKIESQVQQDLDQANTKQGLTEEKLAHQVQEFNQLQEYMRQNNLKYLNSALRKNN